jgi:hypothetical protein
MLSELCLGHFTGHRFHLARNIIANTAGLGVTNARLARKSTVSQEIVVVIAICWPVDDVDASVVYRRIVLGFGRLLHGRQTVLKHPLCWAAFQRVVGRCCVRIKVSRREVASHAVYGAVNTSVGGAAAEVDGQVGDIGYREAL